MSQQMFETVTKICEVLSGMQKCLECVICLHIISDPVKTHCGHRFCRECIQPVLVQQNATCPLCNNAIQRRNITDDEDMKLYVEKLHQFTEAIQMDTGIDISSYNVHPRNTRENSTDATKSNKSNNEGNVERRSSDIRIKPLKEKAKSRKNRKQTAKNTKSKPREHTKTETIETKGMTKYLSKCSLSGVEPLPPDEPIDYEDNSTASGVKNWLESLPENAQFDDPDEVVPSTSANCNLDDTVMVSVSQSHVKIEIPSDNTESANTLQHTRNGNGKSSRRYSGRRRDSKDSSHNRDTTQAINKPGKSVEEKANQKNVDNYDFVDPVPSTSGVTKQSNARRKRNISSERIQHQEKAIDIHRTSPSDMLPAMKQNWSCVAKFGKEMRSKKKKLKSLNISIENKRRQSLDENVKGVTKSAMHQETNAGGKEKQRNISESIIRSDVDKQRLEENESLPNIESTCAVEENKLENYERETSPKNRGNRSLSQEIQTRESSFIVLKEGEPVHIKNLNTFQMNDIIGIAIAKKDHQQPKTGNDVGKQNSDRNTLSLRKERSLSNSPPRCRSNFLQSTPIKQVTEQSLNKSSQSKNFANSPFLSASKEVETSELNSTQKLLSPENDSTPQRKRLSLKKRSSTSNNSLSSNTDPRVLTVKRDLNQQIAETENANGISQEPEKATGSIVKSVKDQINHSSVSGNTNESTESRGLGTSVVAFKKLGRFYKQPARRTKFLYLGSTRLCNQKPRNLVKLQDMQCLHEASAYESRFGNNTRITVNDTLERNETEPFPSLKTNNLMETVSKTNTILETKKSSNSIERNSSFNNEKSAKIVDTCNDSKTKVISSVSKNATNTEDMDDVLIVSLYENEENRSNFIRDNERIQRSPIKSVLEKTVSKNTIKILSPKEDSQLKFLSMDSPAGSSPQSWKFFQEDEIAKDCGIRKGNFSDIKGAQSRALIRRSQQTFEGPQIGSPISTIKKRKRSISREKLSDRMKKISKNDNEDLAKNNFDTDNILSSKTTPLINPKPSVNEIACHSESTDQKCYTVLSTYASTRDIETVSLSSDTEIVGDRIRNQEQEKVYRRIIPLASSSTDSPDIISVNNQNSNTNVAAAIAPLQKTISPAFKRNRPPSSDSDDDMEVNAIVNCWSKDLNPSEKLNKKGKVEESCSSNPVNTARETRNDISLKLHKSSMISANLPSKAFGLQRKISEPEILPVTKKSKSISGRKQEDLYSRDLFDKDSLDFTSTLDKVRNVLNVEIVNNSKARSESETENHLMQDNFDDIIANVDTEALLNQCSESTKVHKYNERKRLSQTDYSRPSGQAEAIVPHSRFSNRNINSSSSRTNKDNECKNANKLYDRKTDTSKGLISEYINVDNRNPEKEALQNNELSEEVGHVSSDDEAQNMTSKDAYDQDSLMNITQHCLLIKQFEEDLFGRPLSFGKSKNKENAKDQHIPPKKKNAECWKFREKDTEHSPEEDDIVENTPDAKRKNTLSMQKENILSSVGSSILKINENPCASPSTDVGKCSIASTPLSRRKLQPLYESTPKALQSFAKSNYSITACIESKKSKVVGNSIETFDKQIKDVAGSSMQIVNRRALCFVCSGLVASQIEQVKTLGQLVNAKYVTQFNRDVTHVIVKANKEDNGANKTLKYLLGIAHRKWIVVYQWVIDSLNEKKLVNEESYEAVDSSTLEAGPRKSRLREKDLFEGFTFLCIGPFVDVSVEQCQDLLRSNGAILVDSLDALAAEKKRLKIIVVQADDYDYEIIGWYKKARAVSIVHDWVVECISQYKLISFYPYLQELSRQDVLALGYPEFLVEEEPDEDSDSVCDAPT